MAKQKIIKKFFDSGATLWVRIIKKFLKRRHKNSRPTGSAIFLDSVPSVKFLSLGASLYH